MVEQRFQPRSLIPESVLLVAVAELLNLAWQGPAGTGLQTHRAAEVLGEDRVPTSHPSTSGCREPLAFT